MNEKEKYTKTEKGIMALTTVLSNVTGIPVILILIYQKRPYNIIYSTFASVTSVLYHLCESLEIDLLLTAKKWHELDNLGALFDFITLILSLTKLNKNYDLINKRSYFFFLVGMVFQARHPWHLENITSPIYIVCIYSLYKLFKDGVPNYNKMAMIKGTIFMFFAIVTFYLGLDDKNDYLRLYHSIWHLLIGISVFYLGQSQQDKVFGYVEIWYYGYNLIKSKNDYQQL